MTVTIRPGRFDDSYAVFEVFLAAVSDLSVRTGAQGITGGDDPEVMATLWERRQPLFEHLARTGDQFWVAEVDGEIIGYARSILRDSVRELTEFFVRPGSQSAGIGRELFQRAFPKEGTSNRSIIATIDRRALGRYLKSGVSTRFPVCGFDRKPEAAPLPPTDLTVAPLSATPATLDAIATIDAAVLGYRRDADHAWLIEQRHGFAFQRDSVPVGYGYVGHRNGPFAALDATDLPFILAHGETVAAELGEEEFSLDVPMINRVAVQYLLGRGFLIDPFFTFFLSDHPFGTFENYIITSPPFFV